MTYFNICREKQSQNSTWLSAKLVCWCNFQDWFSALGELRIGGQDTQKALNQQKASIDRLNLFDKVALFREGSLQKNYFYQFFKNEPPVPLELASYTHEREGRHGCTF